MKFSVALLTVLISTITAYSKTATANDTIIIITPEGNNKSVTYTNECPPELSTNNEGDSYITVINDNTQIKTESDFNFDFPFKPTSKNKQYKSSYPKSSLSVCSSLMIGFVGVANSPNLCKFNSGRSIEIFAPLLTSINMELSRRGPKICLGFGLGWKNFHSQNGAFLRREVNGEDNEIIAVTKFPAGSYMRSSHIHMFSLMVPLIIKQNVGREVQLGLGAILDSNTHMCAKTKYTLDGVETKDNWHPAAKRSISYDVIFTINYSWFGWYVKYSPLSIFNKGEGPNTTAISTGLIIGK